MRAWLFFGACGALLAAQGCSGGSFTATTSSGAGGGSASSSSGGKGGGATSTSTSSSTSTSTSGSSSSGSACPDEKGLYTLSKQGEGCGDLDTTAVECIKQPIGQCGITLVSAVPSAGPTGSSSSSSGGLLGMKGVDGMADIDSTGDFASANMKLGSTQRSGCTGTWNQAGSKLLVDCGGVGSTQSCEVMLTRTSKTCPF